MAKAVPEGFHTVTAHLVVRDCARAIEFYKQAFGAEERVRMNGPGGKIMHAEIKIGDSIVMLGEEAPEWGSKGPQILGGTPVSLHVYSEDANASWKRATEAGATVAMPLADMFWGDRYGQVTDPFGHRWAIGQHLEDLTPEQIGQRQKEFFAKQGKH